MSGDSKMRTVKKALFKKAIEYIETAANFTRTTSDCDGNCTWWVATESNGLNKKVAEHLTPDFGGDADVYLVHEKVYAATAHTIDV